MDMTTLIIILVALAVANSTGIIGRLLQFSALFYLFVVITTFFHTYNLQYLFLNLFGLSIIFIIFTIKYTLPISFNIFKIAYELIKKVVNKIGNSHENKKSIKTERSYITITKETNEQILKALNEYQMYKHISKKQG